MRFVGGLIVKDVGYLDAYGAPALIGRGLLPGSMGPDMLQVQRYMWQAAVFAANLLLVAVASVSGKVCCARAATVISTSDQSCLLSSITRQQHLHLLTCTCAVPGLHVYAAVRKACFSSLQLWYPTL